MKKIFFLFLGLALLAASCASSISSRQSAVGSEQPLVYYTGNDEPAAFAVGGQQSQ
jgi:ABC-type oligopeptide transport system substrate-binding subunit